MTFKRAISLSSLTCVAVVTLHLSGCSSVPKPAEADGSMRVPANQPERVQALQERVTTDRAMLSENNLLRAQVDVLQLKLAEMTALVREALMLQQAARPQPQAPVAPATPAAQPYQQSMPAPALPPHAYSTTSTGVVVRVFHTFARTEFEPSDEVAQALRRGVRGAERVDVSGHTDSPVVNPIDKLIAIERAEKARTWLINNGAEPAKINTRYFTAGHFLTDNGTRQGRALNRRVEIDIRNPLLGRTQAQVSTQEDAS